MRRIPHLLALAGLVAAEVSAIAVLHRLGQLPWLDVDLAHPLRWLEATPPDDAVVAVARLVAVGAAWWLLAVTLLCIGSRVDTRPPPTARAASRWAPRAVRVLVERALVASVASVASVVAVTAPTAAVLANPPSPPAVAVTSETARPLPPPGVRPPPDDRGDVPAAPDRRGQRVHIVIAGEHLWSIASHVVGPARRNALAAYWWRLVEANRNRLVSGDPDLIYPGEQVVLPPR